MDKSLKNSQYDLFFSHGFKSAAMFAMLCRMFRNSKCHYIFDVGCINGARNNSKFFGYYKELLKSNCFLITHTKSQLDFYKNNLKLVNKPTYIQFGVDVDFFNPIGFAKKGYILSFGNSLRDYGTLLEAWAKIDSGLELHLVGSGPVTNEYLKGVRVFPRMSIVDLKRKIEESLFVIIPLQVLNYSCGQMSVLQSMSMGTPVIVSKVSSTIDYIQDGNGAIFVNPYDVDDMYRKILYMLYDRNRAPIASYAREFVITNFSEKTMANQIFEYVFSTYK